MNVLSLAAPALTAKFDSSKQIFERSRCHLFLQWDTLTTTTSPGTTSFSVGEKAIFRTLLRALTRGCSLRLRRGRRCKGVAPSRAGGRGRQVGRPRSLAHRLLQKGYNFMGLRLLDTVTFTISKMLESLFDRVEYRSAKKAAARTAKQRDSNRTTYSRKAIRGSYEFQDGPPESRSLSGLR